MNILERLEDALGKLSEGLFQRSKGKLEPLALARSLIRTMQQEARRGVENLYVPNYFQVQIAAEEYQELVHLLAALAQEWEKVLARKAAERGYSAVGPFQVELVPSDEIEPGDWKVVGVAFKKQEESVESDDTKRWGRKTLTPSFQLRVLQGPDQGKVARWRGEALYIGRAVRSGLCLTDHNVSREHARIEQRDDEFFIADLGSTNGTYLNSQKIQQERLKLGDLIAVGESIIAWESVESWNS